MAAAVRTLARRATRARRPTADAGESGGRGPLLLSMQQTIGNQGVLDFLRQHDASHHLPLALATTGADRPAGAGRMLLQRCGGEVHEGCACASGRETSAVSRQVATGGPVARAAAGAAPAGSRPPLTSPRFAGDAVLEACHQDEARLGEGARGDPVQKVQQALADLGFDLGPKGVDAAFGPRTAQAVRSFKAQEKLGFEQFGDVGPGTMSRLDQLFPPAAPPQPEPTPQDGGEGGEEESLTCPAPDDVVTAIQAEPALAKGQALRDDATQTEALTTGGPSSHMDIPTAVAQFKKVVDVKDASGTPIPGSGNVSTSGQFFVFEQLKVAVDAAIKQIQGGSDADAQQFSNLAFQTVFNLVVNDTKTAGGLIARLDKIAAKTKSPQKAAMDALLRPAGAGGSIDAAIFAAFDLDPKDTMPQSILVKFRSLRALKAVREFDSHGCGGHAFRVAQRIKRKGGLTSRQAKGPSVSATLATGAGFEDRRPMGAVTSAFEPAASAGVNLSSPLMFGDVVLQSGVSSAVAQIKLALDAGKTVHARVMSGLGYGTLTTATGKTKIDPNAKRVQLGPPPEEHSILIIGFDGDTFVFNDPAATVSRNPELGFGFLHFDSTDNRLSTAANAADLAVIPTQGTGDHVRGDKRYQVIRVESI